MDFFCRIASQITGKIPDVRIRLPVKLANIGLNCSDLIPPSFGAARDFIILWQKVSKPRGPFGAPTGSFGQI